MRFQSQCAALLAAAGSVLPLFMGSAADAQVSFSVIVTRFDTATGNPSQVPGLPADQYAAATAVGATITYNNPPFGSPGLSTLPAIDAAGNVAWVGVASALTGPPPTLSPIITTSGSASNPANAQMVFYSSAASGYAYNNILVVARDGNPAGPSPSEGGPSVGNPNGWWLNSPTGGNGLSLGVGLSSSGQMLLGGQLNGTGATTTNNAGFFVGSASTPGGASQVAIRGGTYTGAAAGAVFNSNLNINPNNQSGNVVNPNGQVAFVSNLTGGDTTSGVNDSGLFLGSTSGVSLLYRRGDVAPGTGGATFGASTSSANVRINRPGDVLFSNTISTGQQTVYLNQGGSNLQVMQSGGAVGAAGLDPSVTYLAGNAPTISNQALNNSGTVLYGAKFNPGPAITAGTNDEALMTWNGGTPKVLAQTGTTLVPAPGGGSVTLAGLSGGYQQDKLNNLGHVAVTGTMTSGGSINATNNQALWLADSASGAFQLVASAGSVAPFAGGTATFGNGFFGVMMNNADQIIFGNTLSDGRSATYVWGPSWGLVPILIGKSADILGANYLVGSLSYGSFGGISNGDGGVQNFNDSGLFAFIASATGIGGAFGNNTAIVVASVPSPGAGLIGLLGIGAAVRRRHRN